jgi:hypothetical protein
MDDDVSSCMLEANYVHIDTYIYSYIYSRELLMFVKSVSHIPSEPGFPPWIQLLFLWTFPFVSNKELEDLLQQPMSRF